jgi:predicted Fe-Mo cluster-binding NifX family protein
MKLAVPVNQHGQVDGHFGHCDYYRIFSFSENKEITDIQTIASVNGCGCKSNIASVLAEMGVQTMLAGGIGMGAINVLNQAGIDVIRGCSGDSEELVKLYFKGQIVDSGETCSHHEHHH